jgi:hypothetical protein
VGREEGNGRGIDREGDGSGECNPKCHLYMSLEEDRCGLLLRLGIEPLFVVAGFVVCLPLEMNFWRRLL